MTHHPPELEAVELNGAWYVRTKRTDEDQAGWLIADCSTAAHGKEWARLFASSMAMYLAAKETLREALDSVSVHPCDEHNDDVRAASLPAHMQKLFRAIAAAEGRTEQ